VKSICFYPKALKCNLFQKFLPFKIKSLHILLYKAIEMTMLLFGIYNQFFWGGKILKFTFITYFFCEIFIDTLSGPGSI